MSKFRLFIGGVLIGQASLYFVDMRFWEAGALVLIGLVMTLTPHQSRP